LELVQQQQQRLGLAPRYDGVRPESALSAFNFFIGEPIHHGNTHPRQQIAR
jgi:hypothetical protein